MKQLFSTFLLPVLIIVIFLAKNAERGNGDVNPTPDAGFDRMQILPDSTGNAMWINEKYA